MNQDQILKAYSNGSSKQDTLELLKPFMDEDTAAALLDRIDRGLHSVYDAPSTSFGAPSGAAIIGDAGQRFIDTATGDLDQSDLGLDQFRQFGTVAESVIRNMFPGFDVLNQGLQSVIENRAQTGLLPYRLGAILGQFGQRTVEDGVVSFGGVPNQELIGQAVRGGVSGPQSTGDFRQLMLEAIRGLRNPGKVGGVTQALGFNFADPRQGATGVFGPAVNQFLNPRIRTLDPAIQTGIRGGVEAKVRPLLAGRTAAEINPADFLESLFDAGILI